MSAGEWAAIIAAVAFVAAALHALRWILWRPWRTVRAPLVWVLHLAYAWIPIHLALRAAAALGDQPVRPLPVMTASSLPP